MQMDGCVGWFPTKVGAVNDPWATNENMQGGRDFRCQAANLIHAVLHEVPLYDEIFRGISRNNQFREKKELYSLGRRFFTKFTGALAIMPQRTHGCVHLCNSYVHGILAATFL